MKKNNTNIAMQVVFAGSIFALIALLILTRTGGIITFNERTGVVGDTIGGITGPILNITGLLVVYYSLKEQYIANKQQRKQLRDEINRNSNERYFDFTFRLIEKLDEVIYKNEVSFKKVADLDFKIENINKFDLIVENKEIMDIAEVYEYHFIIFAMYNYYTMIKTRLNSDILDMKQQYDIFNLISISYKRLLMQIDQYYINVYDNDFMTIRPGHDSRPETLKLIHNHLADISQLRIELEKKIDPNFIESDAVDQYIIRQSIMKNIS